jgi:hypothetical protein
MLEHAQAWCQALDANPAGAEPICDAAGREGELVEVIGNVIGRVLANEAAQAAAQARVDTARTARAEAKAAQAAQQRQAAKMAEKVFTSGGSPCTPPDRRVKSRRSPASPVTGTRPPTSAEKAAAGQLARALRTAAYRERTTTVTASAAPPSPAP